MTMTEASHEPAVGAYQVRADAVAPDAFHWRITASNGRTVGRSAATFPSAAAALAALDTLAVLATTRTLSSSVGHRPGGWGWTVSDPSAQPVAQSSRVFDRHGSCVRSLQRFRDALARHGRR